MTCFSGVQISQFLMAHLNSRCLLATAVSQGKMEFQNYEIILQILFQEILLIDWVLKALKNNYSQTFSIRTGKPFVKKAVFEVQLYFPSILLRVYLTRWGSR